ncbi:MAG: hypothetical protein QSU88_04400, partial [Candidatus Methanoperedens sp.]|nr:hypothetical protein [Candidatus Methanoperedens sp.]
SNMNPQCYQSFSTISIFCRKNPVYEQQNIIIIHIITAIRMSAIDISMLKVFTVIMVLKSIIRYIIAFFSFLSFTNELIQEKSHLSILLGLTPNFKHYRCLRWTGAHPPLSDLLQTRFLQNSLPTGKGMYDILL